MNVEQVLIRPLVTEKTNAQMAAGVYTFRAHPKATKPEIRHAVETFFKVPVTAVRTSRVHGKLRRQGKTSGYQSDWKKAVVQLAPGKTIEFFEGV